MRRAAIRRLSGRRWVGMARRLLEIVQAPGLVVIWYPWCWIFGLHSITVCLEGLIHSWRPSWKNFRQEERQKRVAMSLPLLSCFCYESFNYIFLPSLDRILPSSWQRALRHEGTRISVSAIELCCSKASILSTFEPSMASVETSMHCRPAGRAVALIWWRKVIWCEDTHWSSRCNQVHVAHDGICWTADCFGSFVEHVV